jgi:hypothetical protein
MTEDACILHQSPSLGALHVAGARIDVFVFKLTVFTVYAGERICVQ